MPHDALHAYLAGRDETSIDETFLGYIAALSAVSTVSPEIARSIVGELGDQRVNLKLIASENYCSLPVQMAMGNLLTDKYAEGFPFHRFYAGCANVDAVEEYAASQACTLFGCDHAYVQPHSGADANLIAYWAILNSRVQVPELEKLGKSSPLDLSQEEWSGLRHRLGNQRLLGMDMFSGGHLTHGYRLNVSAQMFDAYSYGDDPRTGLIDYDDIARKAADIKPLILLAGYSAYPRHIDFARMREIADSVGAVFLVDMAHFAGLVAGGVFTGEHDPVAHAHVVTTTTHKTLRGPRGGLVLCTSEFADSVDKGCPLVIGGPLPHVMAAKGVALAEANRPEFKHYARAIVDNAHALAGACISEGIEVATGGTDNHLMLLNVHPYGLTGRQGESALRECGITANKNALPEDPNGAWYTSGIRIGTPAVTTLGMGREEMAVIASIIRSVLANTRPETIPSGRNAGKPSKAKYRIEAAVQKQARSRVTELLAGFPVYPRLDLGFLQEHFGGK